MISAPPYDIVWLRSEKTGRRFPTVVFSGDTDMVTMGWASLSSIVRTEVVITTCSADEMSNSSLLESRVNDLLGRNDLRFVPLIRVVENNTSLKGLSFPEFKKAVRPPTLYYKDILATDGEAVHIESVSPEDFMSTGGSVLNIK
jgi:hypothetical protein